MLAGHGWKNIVAVLITLKSCFSVAKLCTTAVSQNATFHVRNNLLPGIFCRTDLLLSSQRNK